MEWYKAMSWLEENEAHNTLTADQKEKLEEIKGEFEMWVACDFMNRDKSKPE